MNAQILDNKKILNSFSEVLDSLSNKEREVIERRVGLAWERETLQNIWDSFNPHITRERVRQIEESWIKKIGRIIKATLLTDIQEKAKELLEMHGWILVRDWIINAIIKELNIEKNINSSVLEVIIQSDFDIDKSKPKLWTKTYFRLPHVNKKTIESVHKETLTILKKKKDIMDKSTLYENIIDRLKSNYPKLSPSFIDSCLDIFDDIVKWEETLIGLTKWKILNPKTLKDKAIYVMKKERIPMHFVDISNNITEHLWDEVKINTIHNELIRNNEFVLIGRGIYALKEWWFKPGTVIDVIIDVLEKNKWPMSTEEIADNVLKIRNVKRTTIYMNLQNKKIIERVWRNYYQLKK